MLSERVGTQVRQRLLVFGEILGGWGITPNMVTVAGFVCSCIVAAIIGAGYPRIGGLLLIIASAFDMFDGAIARATGGGSKLGGFLDSTIDRYSEIVGYLGVLIYLLGTDDWKWGSILVLLSATGALMVSYARARAEALGWKSSGGILARPERVVILGVGLMAGYPLVALAVLAVGTNLTALMRMLDVVKVSQAEEAAAAQAAVDLKKS